MSQRERIYLDHAATSWPKDDAVVTAMDDYARHCGAATGRGGYASAIQADRIVTSVRRRIANLISTVVSENRNSTHSSEDSVSPNSISLHHNGTAALNAAIHGLLRPGDHVVTTAAEHNSVLRPLHHWQTNHNVELTIIPVDSTGMVDADEVLDAVTKSTRMVAITSASNVTGAIQPVERIGQVLSEHPAIVSCDAAQTFGVLPLDVRHSGIDVLAAAGHKGSGGPLGTGFLYVTEELHHEVKPSVHGGTGSQSESLDMPTTMPALLEAGNLNLPALAGWLAALEQVDFGSSVAHHAYLADQLYSGLRSISGIKVFGQPTSLPIASIAIRASERHEDRIGPNDMSAILDAEFGIETRAGLHCAALIHSCIGSDPEGTLRISAGATTTEEEIDAVLDALAKITS